jgi:MoxR-like ATPase
MKNVPKDMLRRDDVIWWMNILEMVDHFVEPKTALTIANWWDDNKGPLILEGPPGGGKTTLGEKIAQALGAGFYVLPCFKSLGKREALYDWDRNVQAILVEEAKLLQESNPIISENNRLLGKATNKVIYNRDAMVPGILAQSLLDEEGYDSEYEYIDESREVIMLMDELDKVPSEEAFEAILLEFLEKGVISIPELNIKIKPRSGKRPHIIITSNAGRGGLRESLSHPVLRRGRYIYLPEADPGRQFCILRQAAPKLSQEVARDAVAFTYWAKKVTKMDKPIALSELIMWARTLEMCKVKELTPNVVDATISELAKGELDAKRLLGATKRIFKIIHRTYYQESINTVDKNVLQFPKQNNQGISTSLHTVNQPNNKKLVRIR